MTFYILIFASIGGKVEIFSLIWGIYARFVKKMSNSLQLIMMLKLVKTNSVNRPTAAGRKTGKQTQMLRKSFQKNQNRRSIQSRVQPCIKEKKGDFFQCDSFKFLCDSK